MTSGHRVRSIGLWLVAATIVGCVMPGSGRIGPTQNLRRLADWLSTERAATCGEPYPNLSASKDDTLHVEQMDCRGPSGVRIRVVRWKSYSLEETGLGLGLRFACTGGMRTREYVDGGGWAAAPLSFPEVPVAQVHQAMDQFANTSRGDLRPLRC